jgi:hypothetical protein
MLAAFPFGTDLFAQPIIGAAVLLIWGGVFRFQEGDARIFSGLHKLGTGNCATFDCICIAAFLRACDAETSTPRRQFCA